MRVLLLLLFSALSLRADDTPIATILCYHEVDDAPSHDTIPRQSAAANTKSEQLRYTVSRAEFAKQLDYLASNGYHVIPLAKLVDYLNGRTNTIEPRAVVITVDDGWSCAYSEILPTLRARKMPFTLFVYPKIVGRGSHAVTWPQVAEMTREPLVEIGSHAFTHPFLTLKNNHAVTAEMYDGFLRHELLDSRTAITKSTNAPIRFLSYPFGDYDEAVVAAAQRFGYEAAVTTERGPITRSTPPMRLKRYLVHNDTTLAEFASWLRSSAPASESLPRSSQPR